MTLAIDEVHVAYCREARRLRGVHAGRPGRMLRAIADLSATYNTRHRPVEVAPPRVAVVRRVSPRAIFAGKIAAELADDVLTYSRRQALLGEAARLGIGRFQANLLIAEAQHRFPAPPMPAERPGRSAMWPIAIALAVEVCAGLALYYLLV